MGNLKNIPPKTFIAFVEAKGCKYSRQNGSHAIFTKKDIERSVVVPVNVKTLPISIITRNLKTLAHHDRAKVAQLKKELEQF